MFQKFAGITQINMANYLHAVAAFINHIFSNFITLQTKDLTTFLKFRSSNICLLMFQENITLEYGIDAITLILLNLA